MTGRRPASAAIAAALLAASACSPGGSPAQPDNAQQPGARTDSKAAPAKVGAPASEPSASASAAARPAAAAKGERRCGWLFNPTPANWWLADRDDQWILGTQGGESAPGMEEMPDMSTAGWVETNGYYGYGCACMTITHDPATRRVLRIADAEPKPLKQCRSDRSLPRPDEVAPSE
ncbi:MAG TPA: DUF4087 domain-containing protein [Allosphingosinicella sp.]|jgi:hypothetical protein